MIVLNLIIFMFLLFSNNGEKMCFKFNTLILKTIVKEQMKCTSFMFNLKHSLKGTENSLIIRTINLLLSLFLTDWKLCIHQEAQSHIVQT